MRETILIVAEKPSVSRDIMNAVCPEWTASDSNRLLQGDCGAVRVKAIAALGHLMELCPPEAYDPSLKKWTWQSLPLKPKEWIFKQAVRATRKEIFEFDLSVALQLPPGSELVNACDAGREGELIFREFADEVAKKRGDLKISRMWLEAMSADSIRKAFQGRRPSSAYDGLGRAAYVRSQADWVWGYSGTRIASLGAETGHFEGRPKRVGRVKTPVMALVVDRDHEIENFKPEDIFRVKARFGSLSMEDGSEAWAESDLSAYVKSKDRSALLGISSKDSSEDRPVFWSKELAEGFADAAAAAGSFAIKDEGREETRKTPMPFSLTDVQREANGRFGWSAKKTLDTLQALYEKRKAMSYPRTDFRGLPTDLRGEMAARLHGVLDALDGHGKLPGQWKGLAAPNGGIVEKARCFDDSQVGDHFGLVPTDGAADAVGALEGDELMAFCLVLERVLEAVSEDHLVLRAVRSWTSEAGGSFSPIVFKATASKVVRQGWRQWSVGFTEKPAYLIGEAEESEPIEQAKVFDSKTKAPPRFTEGTLLGAMEKAGSKGFGIQDELELEGSEEVVSESDLVEAIQGKGLGTPATRASILEELFADKYLARKGRGKKTTISALPKAFQLVGELRRRYPDACSPQVTAEWEFELLKMERCDEAMSTAAFLDMLFGKLAAMKKAYEAAGIPDLAPKETELNVMCPKTGKPLLDRGKYYSAEGWPQTRFYKIVCEREFTPEDLRSILEDLERDGKSLVKGLKGKNGAFEAFMEITNSKNYGKALRFSPKSKAEDVGVDLDVNCPKTKKPIRDCGSFYSAPGWPDVRFYKVVCERELSPEDIESILEDLAIDGKTLVKGLKAKGREFEAYMHVAKNGEYGKALRFCPREKQEVKGDVLEHKCPKTGKPIVDAGKHYLAPGWPGVRFPKVLCKRSFSPAEFASILVELAKEGTVLVEGFVSKSGKEFSARLKVLSSDRFGKSLGFDF